jgi:hypothetical protein
MESSIDAIAIGTYFWAYWGHDKNICDGGTGVRDLLDIYDNQNERLNALFKLIDDNIDASKKSLFSKNNCQPNQTDKFYDEANLRSLYYVLNHQIPQHLDLLSQYNKEWNRHEDLKIKLFSYEGGQHLQLENNLNFLKPSNNKNQELEQIKELYYNANNHQKMNDLYKKLYSYWVKVGGGDFMNFISAQTYSKWAMMGLSQSLDVYTVRAPKYEATIEFARGND